MNAAQARSMLADDNAVTLPLLAKLPTEITKVGDRSG